FWQISIFIILICGILTWLIGRNAIHVGASGVIMGYWGFLLTLAIYQPSAFNIIIVIVMLYYLSSLFLNLFPSGEEVSFEGHICGLVAGVAVALAWVYSSGQIWPYMLSIFEKVKI
ncbi:MAG: rhomboid family intramembrane serine protease, partial [Gammaproteobacteria bacterium]